MYSCSVQFIWDKYVQFTVYIYQYIFPDALQFTYINISFQMLYSLHISIYLSRCSSKYIYIPGTL